MAPLRAHMEAIGADVWVLTETVEDISPGAGHAGVATTGSDREQKPDEVWTKVWSRWRIEALPPASDPVRCVAARVLHPQRGPFVAYATVLPWTGSTWRGLRGAGGVAFGAALDAQELDWAALRADFPADDLFVMGGLNQPRRWASEVLRLQGQRAASGRGARTPWARRLHCGRQRPRAPRFE